MINWSRTVLVPATVVAVIGLAACGSGTTAPSSAGSSAPTSHNMADMAPGETMPPGQDMDGMEGMGHGGHSGSPGALELWAVQTGQLGVVVTDGSGQLFYRFDRDQNAPSVSNCTGACTATWQPVIADLNQPPVLLGVDDDKINVMARPDGGEQLTLAGWPLYRHVGEHDGLDGPQANGTDGVWFAIGPDGGKAAPAPPAAPGG
jgi:predicted lipoprotein with Yx(FWY)xxD motif